MAPAQENRGIHLRNGVFMPIFGLGTSHYGGYKHDAVVYALRDCCYRLIDTAKRYGCESYLHQAIKDSGVSRDDIFLVTKLWPTDYGYLSAQDTCHQSMKRLGTDYLDLYMLHWPNCISSCPNPKQVREETWRALEKMYDEGTLKSIGVSNFSSAQLEELFESCSIVPHVNQVEFHPYQYPADLQTYCQENGIEIQGFCPLAKGNILNEPPVINIARRRGRTPAQILIRWSIEKGVVTIPKSTRKERVLENSLIFDFKLTEEDTLVLDSLHDGRRCVDVSQVQAKIDGNLCDGYKLHHTTERQPAIN